MLFKANDEIKIVGSCPVALGSVGVMEFPPELIATIAGAVLDNIEWMVLLVGERSEDGFHVKVNSFKVPQQQRTSGNVSMDEPMEGPGSTVDDSVVGVLHSHHRMGAFFSGTDVNELNPFFKTSIVIAQDGQAALGFKYKAEGKVTLPCGSIGRINFKLAITGSEVWNAQPVHEVEKNNRGFGDCDQVTESTSETEVEVIKAKTGACGLSSTISTEKPAVFGVVGGEQLLAEIRQMTTAPTFQNRPYQRPDYTGNYGQQGHHQAGYLSRRERKRLKREGKLSARRDGTFGTGSSGYEVGGSDDGVDLNAPHRYAKATSFGGNKPCEMCQLEETIGDKLYYYVGQRTGWQAWLCDDCYDFVAEGVLRMEEADTTLPVATAPQQPDLAITDDSIPPHWYINIPEEGPACIRRFGGRNCGNLPNDAIHVNQYGRGTEKEAREIRERLGIAGLLPPATETIH